MPFVKPSANMPTFLEYFGQSQPNILEGMFADAMVPDKAFQMPPSYVAIKQQLLNEAFPASSKGIKKLIYEPDMINGERVFVGDFSNPQAPYDTSSPLERTFLEGLVSAPSGASSGIVSLTITPYNLKVVEYGLGEGTADLGVTIIEGGILPSEGVLNYFNRNYVVTGGKSTTYRGTHLATHLTLDTAEISAEGIYLSSDILNAYRGLQGENSLFKLRVNHLGIFPKAIVYGKGPKPTYKDLPLNKPVISRFLDSLSGHDIIELNFYQDEDVMVRINIVENTPQGIIKVDLSPSLHQ